MMKKVSGETIDKAILAHSRWKAHLRDAITTGQSKFSVKEVENPTLCKFGEWLYSPEGKKLPNLTEIIDLHKKFHQETASILTLALTGQAEEAKARIQLGSDFGQLTTKLVEALVKIKES